MTTRFTLKLGDDEMAALVKLARIEMRDFRDQARLLIKTELVRRGLLNIELHKTLTKNRNVEEGNSNE